MRLDLSVPKITPAEGEDGRAVPIFLSAREGAERELLQRAGKALLLADGQAFSALLPAMRAGRALTVLWEGDALALFSLPDVSCVLASGGAEVMRAARFFADVRRIPCALFPAESGLDGVFEGDAPLRIAGETRTVSLADATVYCDEQLLAPSLGEGYARLVLSRLALFEERVLLQLAGRACSSGYEEAFALTEDVRAELPPREIVRRNARLRRLEGEGLYPGEGRHLLPGQGALVVQRALSALYYAFLRCGTPRAFTVPDYRARAAAAGVAYGDLVLPDGAALGRLTRRLAGARGELLAELVHLRRAHAGQLRAVRALSPCALPAPRPDLLLLQGVAERVPEGLCAVVRDLGLLEWP